MAANVPAERSLQTKTDIPKGEMAKVFEALQMSEPAAKVETDAAKEDKENEKPPPIAVNEGENAAAMNAKDDAPSPAAPRETPPPSVASVTSPCPALPPAVKSVDEEVAWLSARMKEIKQRLELITLSSTAEAGVVSALPEATETVQEAAEKREATEEEGRTVVDGEVATLAARADDLREHLRAMQLKADLAGVTRMVDEVAADVSRMQAAGVATLESEDDEVEEEMAKEEAEEVARVESEPPEPKPKLKIGKNPEPDIIGELEAEAAADERKVIAGEEGGREAETGAETKGVVMGEQAEEPVEEEDKTEISQAIEDPIHHAEDEEAINTSVDVMLESVAERVEMDAAENNMPGGNFLAGSLSEG